MRIGLFGGTFDPIHWGHLVAAEESRLALGLDRVLFVPAGRPPHRARPPAAAPDARLSMVELAIAGHPGFAVVDLELRRAGPSFTLDTVGELARLWQPSGRLVLLIGLDAFLEIESWHEYRRLLSLVTAAVLTRPGSEPATLARLPDWIVSPASLAGPPPAAAGRRLSPPDSPADVRLQPVPAIDIRSSEIRRRLAAGQTVRYLVHPAVAAFIARHGLYRQTPPAGPPAPAASV